MAVNRVAAKRRVVFIDIARAVAALLVVESHLATVWTVMHHASSPVLDFVNTLFTDPLHVSKQGLGQPGVPMFFLISGFIVTPLAMHQGAPRFAIGRVLRIYPTLIVVVLLTGLAITLGFEPLLTGQAVVVNPTTLLTNATLVNYVLVPQVVLVGVAWTLVVEVIFYFLLIALLPLVRRMLWLAITVELTFVQVVLMTARAFNDNYLLFAVSVSFLPIVIMGQVIWSAYTRRIRLWAAGLLLAASWCLYTWAGLRDMGRLDNSYDLSLAIAVLCLLMGLFAEDRLAERRVWTWLSERTYSIYLWHGLVGYAMLTAVYPYVGFEVGFLIAVVATFVAVEIGYRLIERPSHILSRKLSRPKDSRKSTRDIPAEIAAEVTAQIPRITGARQAPAHRAGDGSGGPPPPPPERPRRQHNRQHHDGRHAVRPFPAAGVRRGR
ncbi:MAG: acyltransferase [Kutzneria sp.]|nr:acyltransferase [Kutzneria sp.]